MFYRFAGSTNLFYRAFLAMVFTWLTGVSFVGFALRMETLVRADGPAESAPREITIREGLAIGGGAGRSRVSLPIDVLEANWVQGKWGSPKEGDEVIFQNDVKRTWQKVEAGEDGWFNGRAFGGGALVANVDSPEDQAWILDAQGNSLVRINGETRMGDVYANGSLETPVALKKGSNEFVFLGSRGRVKARLYAPEKPLYLSLKDTTFPTPVVGENESLWGALVIVNASKETVKNLEIESKSEWLEDKTTNVFSLLPMTTAKVPFQVQLKDNFPAGEIAIQLELKQSGAGDTIDAVTFNWTAVKPNDLQRRTFVSDIDGSVQYYAVRPAENWDSDVKAFDLILSLHGAGVEGQGEAACYAPKHNTIVIAPTNRRAFGFDWEDWGRMDALEVLDLASQRFHGNRDRTYLSGHSMGGHGTWHIGSLFPNRFAAIGPSAGWISFATYAGGRPNANDTEIDNMMARSILSGDTLSRLPNLASQGVYVLHGDRDDNVPVEQARTMREELGKFHPDFVYHEQPGAGHWWGNACVDWPPMIEFLRQRSLPTWEQVNNITFVTPNPGISSQMHWATIAAQTQHGQLSRIDIDLDRANLAISGKTQNVAQLALNLKHLATVEGKPDLLSVELDGVKLESIERPMDGRLWLQRVDDKWEATEPPSLTLKGPHRYGPFKEAFQKRFVFVYGTTGSPEINEWMMAKARLDSESFRYRGNASIEAVADFDFSSDKFVGRNIIVYGNAECNSAWKALLADSPIQVANGRLGAGDWQSTDESLVSLFVRPRPDSDENLVAAIGGTDLQAMRASMRLPIFVSGTGFPDALVVTPDFLTQGTQAIRLAGYFGIDWSFERGNWARP